MVQSVKNGLTPSRKVGGGVYSGATNSYPIANSYNVDLFAGDIVKLSGGYVVRAESSIGSHPLLGVFQGCQYINPTTGQLHTASYFPAGTSSAGRVEGYDCPLALVSDDPDLTYILNATTTVTIGQVGSRYRVSISAGNPVTGRSNVVLDTALTVDASSGAHCRIVGILNIPPQVAGGTAKTAVEVVLTSTGAIGLQ